MERTNIITAEALPILVGVEERLDHFGNFFLANTAELRQPGVVAGEVLVGRVVRVPAQVAEISQQHGSPVGLGITQALALGHGAQRRRATSCVARAEGADRRQTLLLSRRDARVGEKGVNETRRARARRVATGELGTLHEPESVSLLVRLELLLPLAPPGVEALADLPRVAQEVIAAHGNGLAVEVAEGGLIKAVDEEAGIPKCDGAEEGGARLHPLGVAAVL